MGFDKSYVGGKVMGQKTIKMVEKNGGLVVLIDSYETSPSENVTCVTITEDELKNLHDMLGRAWYSSSPDLTFFFNRLSLLFNIPSPSKVVWGDEGNSGVWAVLDDGVIRLSSNRKDLYKNSFEHWETRVYKAWYKYLAWNIQNKKAEEFASQFCSIIERSSKT